VGEIPAVGRLKQEEYEFKASLGSIGRHCLKIKKKKNEINGSFFPSCLKGQYLVSAGGTRILLYSGRFDFFSTWELSVGSN
jgi:hypothetical protein